jgi:thymidylate kinase
MDVNVDRDHVDPLLEEFGTTQLSRNGIPDERTQVDRERCLHLVRAALAGELDPDDIAVSPLGVGWTEVFYVHVSRRVRGDRLVEAGWVPLDLLLGRGAEGRRVPGRWAVVEDGRVLGGVRFLEDGPVDPVRAVLDRCRERGEVRLREVLELRELQRRGRPFPVVDPLLSAAAEVESGLGGRQLAPWASGRTATPPVRLPGRRRTRVVAVSGVDGSGKSTLRAALVDNLGRSGVAVSTVWIRPGMGLGRLLALAAWGKRLLRQDVGPGLRAMAAPGAPRPASRRGAIGWAWALLVTGSFIVSVWRQHLAGRGVVVYDRHLVDALATLDFAYEGVDLRLQRRLVRALMPRADVRLYLDVPAEVAVARKPDDVLGDHAVRRQLSAYARWLDELPPVVRLDATRPTVDLVDEALRVITSRS